MMKKVKRVLSGLLVLAMVLSFVPMSVWAKDHTSGVGITGLQVTTSGDRIDSETSRAGYIKADKRVGSGQSSSTNTVISFKNTSGYSATLEFTLTSSFSENGKNKKITVGDLATITSAGTQHFSTVLPANATFNITLYADWQAFHTSKSTAEISNIKLIHTVKWNDGNNQYLQNYDQRVAAGSRPTYPADPGKAGSNGISYRFIGWKCQSTGIVYAVGQELPAITKPETFQAVYDTYYDVTWKNGDTVLKTTQVKSGEKAVAPTDIATPTKEATNAQTFVFDGWAASSTGSKVDLNAQTVTKAVSYYAHYNAINNPTAHWYNENVELGSNFVQIGQHPQYTGKTPVKADATDKGYDFIGWNPNPETITAEAEKSYEFHAQFKDVMVVRATAAYCNGNALPGTTVGGSGRYDQGSTVTLTASEKDGYTFCGWYDANGNKVTEGLSYTVQNISASADYTARYHQNYAMPAVAPKCEETGLTAGVKCYVCNTVLQAQETVGATGHNWGEAVYGERVDSTCSAEGHEAGMVQTCTNGCGKVHTEDGTPISKKPHTPETVTGKAATCTEDGLTDGSKCSVCGEEITAQQVIPALGHNVVTDEAVAATCTATGLTEGKHCTRCDDETVAQETIDKLAHDYELVDEVAADCTNDGHKTYGCKNCDAEYTDTLVKLGHLSSGWTTGNATHHTEVCTREGCNAVLNSAEHAWSETDEDGTFKTYTCTACGRKKYEGSGNSQMNISKKGVTTSNSTDNSKVGTLDVYLCPGQSAQITLKNGSDNQEIQFNANIVDKNGIITVNGASMKLKKQAENSFTVTAKENITEETTATISYSESVFLSHYNAKITIHVVPHTMVTDEESAATCDDDGYKKAHCGNVNSNCGLVTFEEYKATGHDYAETVVAPTCLDAGYTLHECKNCDASYKDDQTDATGHKMGNAKVTKEPTCTRTGVKTTYCQNVGCTHTEYAIVDMLPHSYVWGENYFDASTNTLKHDGKCSVCGAEVTHTWGAWTQGETSHTSICQDDPEHVWTYAHMWNTGSVTTDPTCTKPGVKTFTCTVCGANKTESVDALGHNFAEQYTVDTAATCTTPGSKSQHCSRCEEKRNVTEIPVQGHDMQEVADSAVAATCTAAGKEADKACSRCENTAEGAVIPATGHAVGSLYKAQLAATCTADGVNFAVYNCGNSCGVYVDGNKNVVTEAQWTQNKLGHDYSTALTAPTCTEQGYTTHTCSRGDSTYVDTYVNALGHSFTNYVSNNNATCIADGTKTATCDRCSATDTIADTDSKLGHSFTNYVSNNDATCTADGTKTATCDRCDATDTVTDVDSKLGHSFTNYVSNNDATCTEDGTKTATCDNDGCKETDTVTDEGSALGHSWNDGVVTTNPTCTATGVKTFTCTRTGCEATKTETVNALGHDFAEEYTVDTAATCTTPGSKSQHCSRCEEKQNVTEIPATGHTEVSANNAVAATCTNAGKESDTVCSVCRTTITSGAVIPVDRFAHVWGEGVVTTESTCETAGVITYTCQNNAAHTQKAALPKTEHQFGDFVSDENATCLTLGTETRVCADCGAKETQTVEDSLLTGHAHTFTWAKSGETYVVTSVACEECSAKLALTDEEVAYSTAVVDKHNVITAVTDYGTDSYTVHKMMDVAEEAPTCTKPGTTGGAMCTICEQSVEGQKIPALGHNFTGAPYWSWIKTSNATEWTVYYTQKCDRCGESSKNTKVIPESKVEQGVITYTVKVTLDGVDYTDSRSEQMGYQVTVDGKPMEQMYSYGDLVSVTAIVPDGMKFSCWKIGETIVSTNETHVFAITGDVHLKLECVKEEETPVEVQPVVLATIVSAGDRAAKLSVNWTLPDGYTLVEAGLTRAYSTNNSIAANTIYTKGTKSVSALKTPNGTFTVNLSNMTRGKTMRVVGYIIYKDAEGVQHDVMLTDVASLAVK